MSHNKPLVITLNKVQNGYTFHSIAQFSNQKQKQTKQKHFFQRNTQIRIPNRLIKEIGITAEQIIGQTVQEPLSQQAPTQQQQQVYNTLPIIQEEEVFCEVDRQTELPQNPAKWFDVDKIHQFQKQDLKQYFSGNPQKTPSLYLKYRNFIYQAYKRNPKKYLTKISCRKILRGDVNAISKIHSFLQKHGIINYCIGIDGNYNFKVTSLLKPFNLQTRPQTCIKYLPKEDEQTAQKQIDTDNMTLTVINKNFSRTFRAYCSSCKLICGVVWFANLSEDQSIQKNLCFQCFNVQSHSQKQKYTKVDIVRKMESTNGKDKVNSKVAWNIEDNIKLLDFMGNSYQRSWRKLLDQFQGKKTIQDIALQFMQFPISNFDPIEEKRRLQNQLMKSQAPKKLAYENQDYLNILLNFYRQAQQQCEIKKEDETKKQEFQTSESPSLLNLIKLMTSKYQTKIKYLTDTQNLLQDKGMMLEDQTMFYKPHNTYVPDQNQLLRKVSSNSQNNQGKNNSQAFEE